MHENDREADLLKRSVTARPDDEPVHRLPRRQRSTPTTSAAAPRTRRSSTATTATSAAAPRSRATRRSARGPAAWRGRCSGTRRSWSSSRRSTTRRSSNRVGLKKADVVERLRGGRAATCDHYIDDCTPPTASLLGRRRAGPGEAGRLASRAGRPVQRPRAGRFLRRAIAAQGLLRLGNYLGGDDGQALHAGRPDRRQDAASPTVPRRRTPNHQGLLLHSVYHRPNSWDHVPPGRKVPCGESSMWGDYHLLELALLIQRIAKQQTYPTSYCAIAIQAGEPVG